MKKITSNNFYKEVKNLFKKYPLESTTTILFICFLMGDKFEKNFAAVGSIGSLIIAYGAYKIAKEQQRSNDQKISEEERKIIRENYKNLINGISIIYNNYRNISEINKGEEILRQVANQAKLELPKDLEDYTQEVYELAREISIEVQGKNNNDKSFDKLHNFFSAHIIYSKYFKNPKKTHEN